MIYQIWELALTWLLQVANSLEKTLPQLPTTPIVISLALPEVEAFAENATAGGIEIVSPTVKLENNEIQISCSLAYLKSFLSEKNTGDRLMVQALLEAGHLLAKTDVSEETLKGSVSEIVKNDQARFFHTVPAGKPREVMFAALEKGRPRFIQPEDRAMSWLDLARDAGWKNPPGDVPSTEANKLLKASADVAWRRIKARLQELERGSVVERAFENQYSVHRDGATWRLTAQALLALYSDQKEVVEAANKREGERGVAALASRVVAEMAICVAPWGKGRVCSTADLDYMLANMSVLLECSSQSDALHYGLATRNLIVEPNGTFTFDSTFRDNLHVPYIHTYGERGFRSAAQRYGAAFAPRTTDSKGIDPKFENAFVAEFGMTPTQVLEFTYGLVHVCLERRSPIARLHRSEILTRLKDAGAIDPELAFNALTLKPRKQWDEKKPVNAEPRDWYPWRFGRRLSLTRRPLMQLDEKEDPIVLVEPALLDRSLEFYLSAYTGSLPGDLFESDLMREWIGHAVNEEGHGFNKTVAGSYKELGFEAREVNITELGGPSTLGDVDALAWNVTSGIVYATECKRLMFARTVGEVGERLQEYTSVAAPGTTRTPIQKHADRMTFLRTAMPALSKLTGIPADKIDLRSALVTDDLVPMQFTKDVLKFVDFVTDLDGLESKVKD